MAQNLRGPAEGKRGIGQVGHLSFCFHFYRELQINIFQTFFADSAHAFSFYEVFFNSIIPRTVLCIY